MAAPGLPSIQSDNVKKVKIASIDPDFIEAEAPVPDGMR